MYDKAQKEQKPPSQSLQQAAFLDFQLNKKTSPYPGWRGLELIAGFRKALQEVS